MIELRRPVGRAGNCLGMVLLAFLGVPGCGNLTSGGAGEVEVLVAADSVVSTAAFHIGAGVEESPLEGELTVQMRVFVLRGPSDWVELTDGVQEVKLRLDGSEAAPVAQGSLPAGRYSRVRTLFRLVHVDVEGGLRIDGEPYVGPVSVTLSPEGFPLERQIQLDVVAGRLSSLVLELRAGRWLRRLNRQEQRVEQEDFAEAQEVRSR